MASRTSLPSDGLGLALFATGVAIGLTAARFFAFGVAPPAVLPTPTIAAAPTAAAAVPHPEAAAPLPAAADVDSDEDGDLPPGVELKMIIAVRGDLGMSKGKTAAQVGHAVLGCYRQAIRTNPEWVKAWLYRAQAKVTLKLDDEAAMDAVANEARARGLAVSVIEDAGRTEVEPGTRTVVGIGPAPRNLIDAVTGPKGMFPLRLLT